jgi:soluble lytic murein transglycosylase-like protein
MQGANAVPDKTLKLVMAELNQVQNYRKVRQVRSKRIKRYISKRRISKNRLKNRSGSCLSWSAAQINRKAMRFDKAITKYSRLYRVDSDLVKSVITAESCFKVKAKSKAGAQGLMQLIPATAKRYGVRNSYNPEQNIRGGVKYLRFLKARYRGNLKKIIAAYNAGEGAVDKYKGIPPYKETRRYVKNVLKIYARLNLKIRRVSASYNVVKKSQKPGRHGWQYNRKLAPHLYKN